MPQWKSSLPAPPSGQQLLHIAIGRGTLVCTYATPQGLFTSCSPNASIDANNLTELYLQPKHAHNCTGRAGRHCRLL
jgi:hypothetical protein